MNRFFAKRVTNFESRDANKLHTEIKQIASRKDRKILESQDDLKNWVQELEVAVDLANSNHPRCKAQKVVFNSCNEGYRVWISSVDVTGGSVVLFQVYSENTDSLNTYSTITKQ